MQYWIVILIFLMSSFLFIEANERVSGLLKEVPSANEKRQEEIKNELLQVGKKALPYLAQSLSNKDPQVRKFTASTFRAMAKRDSSLLSELIEGLKKPEEEKRSQSVMILGAIGPEASPALKELAMTLDDPASNVRSQAAFALAKMGPVVLEYLPEVFQKSSKIQTQSYVIWLAGKLGGEGQEALPLLQQALASSSLQLRYSAVTAIAKIGPGVSSLVPDLILQLSSSPSHIKPKFTRAIKAMGEKASPFLIQTIEEKPKEVFTRLTLIQLLGEIQEPVAEVSSVLGKLLLERDTRIRYTAANALAQMGEKGVPTLMEYLENKDGKVRRFSAWALGKIGNPALPATALLIKTLADPLLPVQENASWALGQIGPRAVPALLLALNYENPQARFLALKTLVQIGQPQKIVLKALFQSLADKNKLIADYATKNIVLYKEKVLPWVEKILEQKNASLEERLLWILEQIKETTTDSQAKTKIEQILKTYQASKESKK